MGRRVLKVVKNRDKKPVNPCNWLKKKISVSKKVKGKQAVFHVYCETSAKKDDEQRSKMSGARCAALPQRATW